ncbi:MAG: phenylalanine--tRNA ligase subunit alpha [Candidatus Thermoplasmatota archaeon]|nr:phenylalanine--tRNA ligase subunit alpha [Candidatus Thermoplasmatota archaeon]
MDLSPGEIRVLAFLRSNQNRKIKESEIRIDGMSTREISSSISWLEAKGYVSTSRLAASSWKLGPEGMNYLNIGLPELRAAKLMLDQKNISLRDLSEKIGQVEMKIALAQLAKYGIRPSSGSLSAPSNIAEILHKIEERQSLLGELKDGIDDPSVISDLRGRESVIQEIKSYDRTVNLTDMGLNLQLEQGQEDLLGEVTSDMLLSKSWQGKEFRKYDLNAPVENTYTAYMHPLSSLIQKIRKIFLEMGFTEMPGHYIEYTGWNMDALFIPQDHPARDLQDTFYLKSDSKPEFEHPEILKAVARAHERGIKSYRGWGYKFNMDEAHKLVLRTHTTVSTIRSLYENPDPPVALFSVEKVFRHESVDWKHLAELHQVEGAVYSKDANLSTLKGLMRHFYHELGFDDLDFIPSYYPYTEPSMDVIATLNGKEIELGGSGIFRPEVTVPAGLKYPVIAWGLGLERLAMFLYDLKDIREIYNSDIEWLRHFQVKS